MPKIYIVSTLFEIYLFIGNAYISAIGSLITMGGTPV